MTLRRILYGCLALTISLGLLTGCWDREEMDDLALVMASGIDLADDGKIELTMQIALPTGMPSSFQSGGKAAKPVLVLSTIANSGVDALDQLQQQMSRQIDLGHSGVIVIGEKYARQGLDQVTDTLMRSPESRYNSYIVTAYGTTAKEILNAPYKMELIPAIGINKIQFSEFSVAVKVDKFLDAIASYGIAPMTGAIRLINKGTDQQTFVIDKVAVYQRNKLVGFLSGRELKAFRLLKGHIDGMKLTAQIEPPKKQYKGNISVQFMRIKTKIRTQIKNGMPEVSVSFKASAAVLANNTSLDMSKAIVPVEKKFTSDLQEAFEDTISRMQKKFKADTLGFGSEIHIEHPYAWKQIMNQWDDLYPEVPVHVMVDFQIERIGRTQAPAQQQKK